MLSSFRIFLRATIMIYGINPDEVTEAFNTLNPVLQRTLCRLLHQANPDLFDQLIGYQDPLNPIDENELLTILNDEQIENQNINHVHLKTLNQLGELFGLELIAFQAPEENEFADITDGARNRTRLR